MFGDSPPVSPVHLFRALKVEGPLKSSTAKFTSLSPPDIAFANMAPNSFIAFQPLGPKLPLPSSARMMSTLESHLNVGAFTPTIHGSVLHISNSNLSGSSSCAQVPCPNAASITGFMRYLRPVLHILVHGDQELQSPSSQSWLQDCMLHASVSEVSPHGSPPFMG